MTSRQIFEYTKRNIVPEDFIRTFVDIHNEDAISWDLISSEKMSLDFARDFKEHIHWWNVSWKIHLYDDDFIFEFRDSLLWYIISYKMNLTDKSIRQFKEYLDWKSISESAKLSEKFIRTYQDKIVWKHIWKQKLSKEFINEFKHKLGK